MNEEKYKPQDVEQRDSKGQFSVERQFSVVHYEPSWPPYDQREKGVQPEKKCRFMSDLLNKKIVRELREEISSRMFNSIEEIKIFLNQFVCQRVTEQDFGEMAKVKPTITERVARGGKFIQITVGWDNPNPTDRVNDPWFSVRVVKKQ